MHSAFKGNFSHFYKGHVNCPLNCSEHQLADTQEHLLICSKIAANFTSNNIAENNSKFDYSDIYIDCEKSLKQIAVMFTDLLEVRQKLIEPPDTLDPCTDLIASCAMNMQYLHMY